MGGGVGGGGGNTREKMVITFVSFTDAVDVMYQRSRRDDSLLEVAAVIYEALCGGSQMSLCQLRPTIHLH